MSNKNRKLRPDRKKDPDEWERVRKLERAAERRYYEKNKEIINKKRRERESDDRRKKMISAHSAVKYAVKTGKLKKPKSCEICGDSNVKINAHHKSYEEDKRLDVIWVCTFCHMDIHSTKNK